MGARGSYGFKIDGDFILQYNHSNSCPSDLGEEIIKFINSVNNWEKLKTNVKKLVMVKERDEPSNYMKKKYKKFYNADVNCGQEWYSLLRELQNGKNLYIIYNGRLKHWMLNNDFIKDSLSCKYAYIIDLDDNVIWFCKGSQKEPQENNPFGQECIDKYYPVKVIDIISLKKITIRKMHKIYDRV